MTATLTPVVMMCDCKYMYFVFLMVLAVATVPGGIPFQDASTLSPSPAMRAAMAHRPFLGSLLHEPIFKVVMTRPVIILRPCLCRWRCGGCPALRSPVVWTWRRAAPPGCGAPMRG